VKDKITLFPGMAGVTRDMISKLKKQGTELFSVDIMVTQKCNFKCIYCYADGAPERKNQLSLEEAKRLVQESLALGVRVLNMQGGEPFMWHPEDWQGAPRGALFHLMEYIKDLYAKHDLPINIVSFTDVALIGKAEAERLIELGVSLCCKLDSVNEQIQDRLLGAEGGFKKIMKGYECLINAGYGTENSPPLSTNTVVTTLNYDNIEDVFRWSRKRGFKPFVIPVHVHGRAKEFNDVMLSGKLCGSTLKTKDIKNLFEKLAEIDGKEFDIHWKAESPWIENKACSRHLGGVHVRADGIVLPCSEAPDEWALGDIRKGTLKEIVTSEKVKKFRNIYSHLHEGSKCSAKNCPLSKEGKCYGCRTRAYDDSAFDDKGQYNSSRLDPEAFFAGDPACWRE